LVKYYTIDSSTLEENNYRSGNIDIIMEYIEGFNLKEYISRFSPIDDLKLKHICRNLLNGLDFLSSNKIIHRDLKPENILVNDTLDVVKITDFALSTYYNYINDSNIINTPTVGSPWYMAPEIVLRQSYGFDADIWSLGCIIYEMKCGQKPYNDINYNQAKIKIMEYGNPLEYAEDGIKDIFYDKSNRDILEFLLLCWRANNMFRPSAKELLNHPWLNVVDLDGADEKDSTDAPPPTVATSSSSSLPSSSAASASSSAALSADSMKHHLRGPPTPTTASTKKSGFVRSVKT